MASATVALPYVVREVLPVLQEIGTDQEQAATTLGAAPFTIFRRITLPSIRRSLAYGVTLTTARVIGEFGAVAVVSGLVAGRTETLTLFVQDGVENLNLVAAYAGAVILALVALAVLALVGADRREPTQERRKPRWRSRSDPSPSDSEVPLLSTT
jgi:sulfate transport system permease protein